MSRAVRVREDASGQGDLRAALPSVAEEQAGRLSRRSTLRQRRRPAHLPAGRRRRDQLMENKMEPRSVSPETPITAYTLSPPLREKAEAHAHAKHMEYAAGTIWGIVILFLILRLRLAARFQTIAERAGRKFF